MQTQFSELKMRCTFCMLLSTCIKCSKKLLQPWHSRVS